MRPVIRDVPTVPRGAERTLEAAEIGLVPPAEFEANHWASQPAKHYPQNPVLTEVGSN